MNTKPDFHTSGPGADSASPVPEYEATILVVDDEPELSRALSKLLSRNGYHVLTAGNGEEGLVLLRKEEIHLVLSDLQMPGIDGLDLLAGVRERRPDTPVILMTAFGTIQSAVTAMRGGALDFVTKPFEADELLVSIERAFERRALEEENRRLRRAVARLSSLGELVGKSPAMNEIYAMIKKIATGLTKKQGGQVGVDNLGAGKPGWAIVNATTGDFFGDEVFETEGNAEVASYAAGDPHLSENWDIRKVEKATGEAVWKENLTPINPTPGYW